MKKNEKKALEECATKPVCEHKDMVIVPTIETAWGIDDRYYIQCFECETVLSKELTREEAEEALQRKYC